METSAGTDRIAVLIDGDNTRPSYADDVLSEVAKYGNPTIKRVYGDWTSSHLNQWARKLNGLGLRAMHQAAFTTSKNSTDLALVIDAMDLLYDDHVEAFALVTSDSDFTSLAHRLRESGKTVYVLGESKAPAALKNACDKFIDLGVVQDEKKPEPEPEEPVEDLPDDEAAPAPINLQSALTRAINAISDEAGWATLPALGNQLNRTYPSFDARTFAGPGARLSTLVAAQPYLVTEGSGNTLRIRLKGSSARKAAKQPAAGKATRESAAEPAAEKPGTQKPGTQKAAAQKATAKKATEKTAEKTAAKKTAAKKAVPVVTQTQRG